VRSVNPTVVEEEDCMVPGRFFLLYNIGYKLDQKYFFLFVHVLHTKKEHHNVCMNDSALQDLRVQR
jgi:hypothetical protein